MLNSLTFELPTMSFPSNTEMDFFAEPSPNNYDEVRGRPLSTKDTPKTKPHIQMTMKGPSRKHVIIPMGSDNNASFMKNSSTHVTNINRVL